MALVIGPDSFEGAGNGSWSELTSAGNTTDPDYTTPSPPYGTGEDCVQTETTAGNEHASLYQDVATSNIYYFGGYLYIDAEDVANADAVYFWDLYDTTNGTETMLYVYDDAGTVTVEAYTSDNTGFVQIGSAWTPTLDTWYYVEVYRNQTADEAEWWVDNASQGTASLSGTYVEAADRFYAGQLFSDTLGSGTGGWIILFDYFWLDNSTRHPPPNIVKHSIYYRRMRG